MGRPRKTQDKPEGFKEQQMEFTDIIEVEDIVAEEPVKTNKAEVTFPRVALGIHFSPVTGYKHVIEIPFNDNLEVGKPLIISEGDGMDMARERFKIIAQQKVLKSE